MSVRSSVYSVDTTDTPVFIPPAAVAGSGATTVTLPAALVPTATAVGTLFQRSQIILAEIQAKQIRTAESIFRCTDLYRMPVKNFEGLYAERGDGLLQMCDLNYDLNRARIIYRIVQRTLKLTYPISALQFAIAEMERVAGPGELSLMAYSLARGKDLNAAQIVLSGKERLADGYAFIVIGNDPTSRELSDRIWSLAGTKDYKILDVLRLLKGCVVVDAYLGMIFLAEDVDNQPLFVSSLRAMEVKDITACADNGADREILNRMLKEVETIYAKVQEQGGIQRVPIDLLASFAPTYNFVRAKRQQLAIRLLERSFPESTDKWKLAKSGVLWGQFNKTLSNALYTMLTELGISTSNRQVAGKDEYVIQIPFSSYDIIKDTYEKIKRLNRDAAARTLAGAGS